MPLALVPLQDRVIVKRDKATEKVGNIIVPDAEKKKPHRGVVVAVGPGRRNHDNTFVGMGIKVGDKVWFQAYAGMEIEYENELYQILSENELQCAVPAK